MSANATSGALPIVRDEPKAEPVPAARKAGPVLLEHSYDGIREYDNPLPGWWRYTFYATIVFAIGYWFWFNGGPGKSDIEQYTIARKAYDDERAVRRASEGEVDEKTLSDRALDRDAVERGTKVFGQYCVPCHSEGGRGLVGPNLTDDFQKHGHNRADLFKTVHGGAPGTAMIAWSETLKPDQVLDVVAYVTTLRNTNVPGGKPPEGERVEAFAK